MNCTFTLEQVECEKSMLSRDCDGCSKLKECSKRYLKARIGDKVYCADGTAHLIDCASAESNSELVASQLLLLAACCY